MSILRKILICALPLIAVCMLCSCSADSNSTQEADNNSSVTQVTSGDSVNANTGTQATTTEATTEATTTTEAVTDDSSDTDVTPSEPSALATVYINTVSDESDAINFVTKPVSPHVSSQIASWTPNYIMPPEPYYEPCTVTLNDGDGNVLLDSLNADVKVRGNWTTNYEKKPLRIKFEEPQNMLGLNDGADMKNWLLLAEYKDRSMLRNKTIFQIANELYAEDGYYCTDSELVEVYINGEYWGVYLLAEQQQINKDRVDITEAEEGYEGTDIGYFLEFDGYFYTEDALQSFHVDYADNAELIPYDGNDGSGRTITCLPTSRRDPCKDVGFTIKSDIYSQAQHDFIANFVNCVYRIMYEAAYNDKAYVFNEDYSAIELSEDVTPQQAVEMVVDTKSLAYAYIINELGCDADIYWSSFFMSVDFGENGNRKLTFEAPWDFDSALGNKARCETGRGFYASNIVPDVNGGPYHGGEYETVNPWLVVLAYEDWYQQIIRECWSNAYDSGVFDRAYEMIETDKTQYSEAFERNYDRWSNMQRGNEIESELCYKAKSCLTHEAAANYLKEWLTTRVEFINEKWHL